MTISNNLSIPQYILVSASGISERIIRADIKSGVLRTDENGYIWYRDALLYVFKKWNEGKTLMYHPCENDPDNSFAARVLSRLDDQMEIKNLEMKWNRKLQ